MLRRTSNSSISPLEPHNRHGDSLNLRRFTTALAVGEGLSGSVAGVRLGFSGLVVGRVYGFKGSRVAGVG